MPVLPPRSWLFAFAAGMIVLVVTVALKASWAVVGAGVTRPGTAGTGEVQAWSQTDR